MKLFAHCLSMKQLKLVLKNYKTAHFMKKIFLSLLLTISTGSVFAQNNTPDSTKLVPIESLKPLETPESSESGAWDLGVTASNIYYASPEADTGLFIGYYRPWAWYSPLKGLRFDARARLNVQEVIDQPEDAGLENTVYGNLEILSVQQRFNKANLSLGRQFFYLGQGLLFSDFADGAIYTQWFNRFAVSAATFHSGDYGDTCELNIQGCSGYTPYRLTPGLSADQQPAATGQRVFAAGEISSMLGESRTYIIVLYSYDLIEDESYAYNPLWTTAGAEGVFFKRFDYNSELSWQSGTTHSSDGEKTDISAWAVLGELTYTMPVFEEMISPNVSALFATGSGDGDLSSAAYPTQVNTSGDQLAFSYFGSYSLGLSYRPTLTNLQVYSLAFQFRPLNSFHATKDLAIELRGYHYRKSEKSGAVLDPEAVNSNADLGLEGDAVLSWRVLPDVHLYYGFGWFSPGAAYPSGAEDRSAHLVSASFNF